MNNAVGMENIQPQGLVRQNGNETQRNQAARE